MTFWQINAKNHELCWRPYCAVGVPAKASTVFGESILFLTSGYSEKTIRCPLLTLLQWKILEFFWCYGITTYSFMSNSFTKSPCPFQYFTNNFAKTL